MKVARSDVTGDQQVTTLEVDRGVRKGVARAADAPDSWDGQVEFKAKRMDAVFVAPGGDFRPYTKLMIDPTDVAFHKDWMKNINRETQDTGGFQITSSVTNRSDSLALFRQWADT